MGDASIKIQSHSRPVFPAGIPLEAEGMELPPAAHALAGAGASRFYKAFNQHLNDRVLLRQLNATPTYMSPAARYWVLGIAAAAMVGLVPANDATNRIGDNFFETAGGILSVGSEGLVILSGLAAPLVYFTKPEPFYLSVISRATMTARYFGAGAGVLFSLGDVVATLEEPNVSDWEIGLSAANAAASLGGVAIAFAPANGFPGAGTAAFLVLLGGSYALSTLQAEVREQRQVVEKAFEFLRRHPKLSDEAAKPLNNFLYKHMDTRGVFLFMERLIESGDVSALRGLPPFIKRTVQRKLYEHLYPLFQGRAKMYDVLLELYGASEGEEKKKEEQLFRRLRQLNPSTRDELNNILTMQDKGMLTRINMGQ